MTTLFCAVIASGALLVLAAVIKGALTKNPFDESLSQLHRRIMQRRQADHDKARHMARAILKRI